MEKITKELFIAWRVPRFGMQNPTRADNPVWEWLIQEKLSAYAAKQTFTIDDIESPTWSFDRFGQSETTLADGRIIYIGGEHEDYYDPDFNIYNDVVVINPDKSIQIYLYPKEEFPPTDFHSATLVGNKIYIIGCLGYYDERKPAETPVYILNTDNFKIEKLNTSDNAPGWIFRHSASHNKETHSIVIDQGEILLNNNSIIENICSWTLNLNSANWELLNKRNWKIYKFYQMEKKRNFLWNIRSLNWEHKVGWDDFEKNKMRLMKDMGFNINFELIDSLYKPDVEFEQLPVPDDESYNTFRILIKNTTIRFIEDSHSIQMIIEGGLPEKTIYIIQQHLKTQLEKLLETEWRIEEIFY